MATKKPAPVLQPARDAATALRELRYVEARAGGATQREAAIAAGYNAARAEFTGSRLEQRPRVRAALEAARARIAAALAEKSTADAARLEHELAHVGFSDIRHYFRDTEDGLALRPASEWPDGAARALAGVKVRAVADEDGEGFVVEFKLWPKLEALQQLAKLKGYLAEDDARKVPTSITVNFARE